MRSPVLVELVCKGKENFMLSKQFGCLRLSKNINLHPPAPNVATKWTKPAELQWSQLRMGRSSTRGRAAREMTVKLFMEMLMVDILTKSGTIINISINQNCKVQESINSPIKMTLQLPNQRLQHDGPKDSWEQRQHLGALPHRPSCDRRCHGLI